MPAQQNVELSFLTDANPMQAPATVAVIGGGAAGLSVTRTLLKGGANVVLLEASSRLGGNCFGMDVTGADGTVHRVDAGVSDFNRNTFKELGEVIAELGLETHPISSDLSVFSKTGESLISSINGALDCAPELGSPTDLAAEMAAFRVRCEEVVTNPKFSGWTIGQYLDHVGVSDALRNAFVLPRAMGSFPMPDMDPTDMPMDEIVRFWLIHGIVGSRPADRHTVKGGMYKYVEKLSRALDKAGADIQLNTRVLSVTRHDDRVVLSVLRGVRTEYLTVDQVVFAVHARSVLPLIADDVSATEAAALASFKVQRARVVVHHDADLMAVDRAEWGAFNYVAQDGDWPAVKPTITFYPNRLGRLPADVPDTFVTMNPFREPRADSIVSDAYLVHPVAEGGEARVKATAAIDAIQGQRRTWWAGSYLRSPYVHESAFTSGRVTAELLLASSMSKSGEEKTHELVITFADGAGVKAAGKDNVFDVTLKLRAPRKLAVRGIRVV